MFWTEPQMFFFFFLTPPSPPPSPSAKSAWIAPIRVRPSPTHLRLRPSDSGSFEVSGIPGRPGGKKKLDFKCVDSILFFSGEWGVTVRREKRQVKNFSGRGKQHYHFVLHRKCQKRQKNATNALYMYSDFPCVVDVFDKNKWSKSLV